MLLENANGKDDARLMDQEREFLSISIKQASGKHVRLKIILLLQQKPTHLVL